MRSLIFVGVACLALSAAACSPIGHPEARAALDCPASQGKFKRSSVAPDRKSCAYATAAGDEIDLRLVPVSATPEATLLAFENQLQAQIGAGGPASDKASGSPNRKSDGDEDEADGEDSESEHAKSADRAQIDLPGIHITADDSKNKASVQVGGMIHVDASDHGAVTRVDRDVRLRGEMLSPVRHGFRAAYVVIRDDMPGGFKTVGYEAGGPKTGPLTVALIKARPGHHDQIIRASRKLVRINGGI